MSMQTPQAATNERTGPVDRNGFLVKTGNVPGQFGVARFAYYYFCSVTAEP